MAKVLFPTDFSDFSKKALEFACPIVEKTGGELILFYSIHVPGSTTIMMNEMMDVLEGEAENDLQLMVSEITRKYQNLDVSATTGVGDPVMSIKEYARKTGCDLIIMGTKGASGLKKALIGSNAAGVINNLETPALLIPEDSVYTGLNHVLYASDLTDLDDELDRILDLTKLWNPEITVLHVFPESVKLSEVSETETGVELIRRHHYDKLKFKSMVGNNPLQEIEHYLDEDGEKDVLVMFAEKRSLLARVWDRSISKKMAFHASLPLLVFPKK